MLRPITPVWLCVLVAVMTGCQSSPGTLTKVATERSPVGDAAIQALAARVQVGFVDGLRKLLAAGVGGGFTEADVASLGVSLIDETDINAPVTLATLEVPRPASGGFTFTLGSLGFNRDYRVSVTARHQVSGGAQDIGTGSSTFHTTSTNPTETIPVTVNVQLANRTYQGEAPVGVGFVSGNLTQPGASVGLVSHYIPTGSVTAVATGIEQVAGVAVDASGNIYAASTSWNGIQMITPAGAVSTLVMGLGSADGDLANARLNAPTSLAIDGAGNLYVADTGNHRIRKITQAGAVSTLAGSTAGYADSEIGANAQFYSPQGVAVDGDGNVYVADTGNYRIRKITPGGQVSTLAGNSSSATVDATGLAAAFVSPAGVALDRARNVYVADAGGQRIRKITPAGVVTTLAGNGTAGGNDGSGNVAQFHNPNHVAVDALGQVYVADQTGHTIRRISPAGVVTTVAGLYMQADMANGVGANARFYNPKAVAVGPNGRVYVADFSNTKVRRID